MTLKYNAPINSMPHLSFLGHAMDVAIMGELSLKPGPRGRARWGIGQQTRALTRKIEIQCLFAL